MSLLSHDTRFCPDDALIPQKMTHIWPICAQIISVVWVQTTAKAFQSHNWLMRNVCKAWNTIRIEVSCANTPSSIKMVPKLRNFGARNEQLSGYYGQNKAWAWFQFAAKLFKSLNLLISKVYRTWEGKSTCLCYPMTPVSVQMTPKFRRKWHISGLFVPK